MTKALEMLHNGATVHEVATYLWALEHGLNIVAESLYQRRNHERFIRR